MLAGDNLHSFCARPSSAASHSFAHSLSIEILIKKCIIWPLPLMWMVFNPARSGWSASSSPHVHRRREHQPSVKKSYHHLKNPTPCKIGSDKQCETLSYRESLYPVDRAPINGQRTSSNIHAIWFHFQIERFNRELLRLMQSPDSRAVSHGPVSNILGSPIGVPT